jgi:23S rRNA G2445 N2-methylase RlmL
MCGGGTFCIEAAWIALNRPPGLTRKWFGFMGWPDFDRPAWNALRDDARRTATARRHAILGTDVRRDAIAFASTNAKTAGMAHTIVFEPKDFVNLEPPEGPPGIIICNPPYGERLGDEHEWVPLHRAMGDTLSRWPGWRLLVFTASDWLARQVGRKVVKQTPFFNGSLPCKLWEFA